MSEEQQRIIGGLQADVAAMKLRIQKLEGLVWKLGMAAVGVIITYLLRQAGLI